MSVKLLIGDIVGRLDPRRCRDKFKILLAVQTKPLGHHLGFAFSLFTLFIQAIGDLLQRHFYVTQSQQK